MRIESAFPKRILLGLRAMALGLLLLACGRVALAAQDPSVALPKNFQTLFTNSAVEVVHVHYAPHEKIPLHDHSKFPTVYVYLSDSGPVLFSHVEEHPFTIVRRALKMGAFRVSPGRIERHTTENQGDIGSDFLRVELKQVPLGRVGDEFRGSAPENISRNWDVVEFKGPDVSVERIICVAGPACAVKASDSPSLLIAFTGAELTANQAASSGNGLKAGSVNWIASGESVSIKSPGGNPAHVLRILLTTGGR